MGVSAAAAWAGLGQQGAQKSTANPAHWEGLVPRTAYPDKAQIGKHGNCPQVLLNCEPIRQGQCPSTGSHWCITHIFINIIILNSSNSSGSDSDPNLPSSFLSHPIIMTTQMCLQQHPKELKPRHLHSPLYFHYLPTEQPKAQGAELEAHMKIHISSYCFPSSSLTMILSPHAGL